MFIGFPFLAGTSVLIYLAGLMSISTEVIESAKLEGATGFSRIRHIDVPLLTGQIKLFLVLGIIGNVQRFGDIFILTQGGPGFSTNVPGLVMYYAAFSSNQLGYAAAIGLVMFVVILLFTVIVMRFIRSSTEFEGR
jgi:ABC-type sugar transport system permease subunit